jgi:hypothetical protein
MSADNWAECPKCRAGAEEAKKRAEEEARASYGKVPAEQYVRLLASANQAISLPDTLREDYELGLSGTEFYVAYRCSCQECGFEYSYRHRERVP